MKLAPTGLSMPIVRETAGAAKVTDVKAASPSAGDLQAAIQKIALSAGVSKKAVVAPVPTSAPVVSTNTATSNAASAISASSAVDPASSTASYEAAARSSAASLAAAAATANQSASAGGSTDSVTAAQVSAVSAVGATAQPTNSLAGSDPRVEAVRALVEKLTGKRMRVIPPALLVSQGRTPDAEAAANQDSRRTEAQLDAQQAQQIAQEKQAEDAIAEQQHHAQVAAAQAQSHAEAVAQAAVPATGKTSGGSADASPIAMHVHASGTVTSDQGGSVAVTADVAVTQRFVEMQGIQPGAVANGQLSSPIQLHLPGDTSQMGNSPIHATVDSSSESNVRVLTSTTGGTPHEVHLGPGAAPFLGGKGSTGSYQHGPGAKPSTVKLKA